MAGTAETPCGPISPPRAASVWLRLDGPGAIEAGDVTLHARAAEPTPEGWSLHYQVFDGDAWVGAGDGAAVLSLGGVLADGRASGGIAACFADDVKSCVSGSFVAASCPPGIDQPVRGRLPAEVMRDQ